MFFSLESVSIVSICLFSSLFSNLSDNPEKVYKTIIFRLISDSLSAFSSSMYPLVIIIIGFLTFFSNTFILRLIAG